MYNDSPSTQLPHTSGFTMPHPDSVEYEIIHYLTQFKTLSLEEMKGVLDSLNLQTFKKGTILLREGQIANLCYFVMKGCVRQYYLVDGVEKTTQFFTEGAPITPYEGTHKRTASRYYLACVEDSVLSVGTPEREAAFFEQFPHLKDLARVVTEEELGKSQENLSSFIIHSPEERYRNLLETRPDLLDRVPQYQLASYLGVTPESLSRIRKRITGK